MRSLLTLKLLFLSLYSLSAQTISFSQIDIATGLSLFRDVKSADMDGDNDLDILVASGGRVDWYKNLDGHGNFDPMPIQIGDLANANVAFATDIDGNGTMDVIVGTGNAANNSEVGLYKNLDTLGMNFSAKITLATLGNQVRDVIAADFDGDQDLDIVYASYDTDRVIWLRNTNGLGTFSAPIVINSPINGVRYLSVADVDGDNDMDIFSSSLFPGSTGQFSLFKNTDGLGTFVQSNINDLDGNNATGIVVADFDGDNDVDLAGCMYNSDKVYWYKNLDGAGMFGPRLTVSAASSGPLTINSGDIDGDGDNDLIVANEKDNKTTYSLNNGQGAFATAVTIPTTLNFANAFFSASKLIATADMDNDGDLDILAISTGSNQLSWLKNTPALSYNIQETSPLCNSNASGTISIQVSGGTMPYQIMWSNPGLSGFMPTGLAAGLYSYVISDGAGTQINGSIQLTEPPPFQILLSSTPATIGNNNGTASAQVSGGTAPYSFLWSNGSNASTINNLAAGSYIFSVTDNNACIAIDTVIVGVLSGISEFYESNRIQLSPNPVTDRVFFKMDSKDAQIEHFEISELSGRIILRQSGLGLVMNGFIQLPVLPPSILIITIKFSDGTMERQKLMCSGSTK